MLDHNWLSEMSERELGALEEAARTERINRLESVFLDEPETGDDQ